MVLKGGSRFFGSPFLRAANKGKDCSPTSFVGKDKCCCSCLAGQMGKAVYTALWDALGRGRHTIPNLRLSYLLPGQDFVPPRGIPASCIFCHLLLRLSVIIIAVSACSCLWCCPLQPWSHPPPIFRNAFILLLISQISSFLNELVLLPMLPYLIFSDSFPEVASPHIQEPSTCLRAGIWQKQVMGPPPSLPLRILVHNIRGRQKGCFLRRSSR